MVSGNHKKPPKTAERILKRLLPDKGWDTPLGDFEEDYNEVYKNSGRFQAALWYFMQILKISPDKIRNEIQRTFMLIQNYIKIAIRNLLRNKFHSFINVAGMAIGLSCSILIFLFITNEIKFDHQHTKKDRIYRLIHHEKYGNIDNRYAITLEPVGAQLKSEIPEIEDIVRLNMFGRISVKYGESFIHTGNYFFADDSFFDVFDFNFYKGSKESVFDDLRSVVLTRKGAVKYFGSDDIVGETLQLDRWGDCKVTGVLEDLSENSHLNFELLLPMKIISDNYGSEGNWRNFGYITYLLLKEGSDIKSVEDKLSVVNEQIRRGDQQSESVIELQSMADIHFYSGDLLYDRNYMEGNIEYIYILSGLVLIILFIACFNYTNLSVAKSGSRSREVGIRKVVGAKKNQVVNQFLVESIIVTLIAFFIGLLFARFLLPVFNELSGRNLDFSSLGNFDIVIMLAVLVLVIGFFSNLYPSLFLSAFRPVSVLRGSSFIKSSKATLRRTLVVIQFALMIAMIIVTFAASEQMDYISRKMLGFNEEQIITLEINSGTIRRNWDTMKEQLLQIPDVTEVSISSKVPFGRQSITNSKIKLINSQNSNMIESRFFTVDDDFIKLYDIPIASGRNISREYGKYDESILINETAAGMFGWDDPVGQKIFLESFDATYTVTGVVKDFHFESLHQRIAPLILPVRDEQMDYISIRFNSEKTGEVVSNVTTIHKNYDKNLPEFAFVDQTFQRLYDSDRKMKSIFEYAALFSIIISSLGLFGLSSYLIEQRKKEIGIRKVLGASDISIYKIVSKEFLYSLLIANIIAWPTAYYAVKTWMENFAYKVEISILFYFISGFIALLIVSLTVTIHSVKSTRSNPVENIKYE